MKTKKKAIKRYECSAVLTVNQIGAMTEKGRSEVCEWLRKQADDIESNPENYSNPFRARYLYPSNTTLHVQTGREEGGL